MKLEQFLYDIHLRSKEVSFIEDSITGNPIIPNIRSGFQNSLRDLCREVVREESRYKEISKKIESVRDLKIDDSVSLSFTLFAHIYGCLDRDANRRKYLPLEGWKIIVKHSEGKLERKPETERISYSQVKELIDGIEKRLNG